MKIKMVINKHIMSLIITRPVKSPSGETKISDTVLASSSKIVDTINTSTSKSVKWILAVTNTTTNDTQTSEVLAQHRNGISPSHNRFAVIGDTINLSVDVVINASNLELEITNNETNDISILARRFNI
jgi:hypothetical protein